MPHEDLLDKVDVLLDRMEKSGDSQQLTVASFLRDVVASQRYDGQDAAGICRHLVACLDELSRISNETAWELLVLPGVLALPGVLDT